MTEPKEVETAVKEPTDSSYAVFGRYVAALLGAHEAWEFKLLDEIEVYAASLSEFPVLGDVSDEELAMWRTVAGQLGITYPVGDTQCTRCGLYRDNDHTGFGLCMDCIESPGCTECDEYIPVDDVHAHGGRCGSCVHNARRSG